MSQTLSFRLFFSTPIGECIQEKISSLARKASGCFEFNWEYIFFSRAVCNHGAVLFPMIARPLAKYTHMHTNLTRTHGVAVWKCDFTTSTKYSEWRSEWRDIRHPSPGDITIFVHQSALFLWPSSCAPCSMDLPSLLSGQHDKMYKNKN